MDMKITLQKFQTPNFVLAEPKPTTRGEGFNPESVPKWSLSEVDEHTLSDLCDKFREDVFAKAGKKDPNRKS